MDALLIRGGSVLTDTGFVSTDLFARGGRIVAEPVAPAGAVVIDADGLFVAPGFVDVQINGGWGHDFTTDPSSIGSVAAVLPATGVTAFLPTIVSSTRERRTAARRALAELAHNAAAAVPLGLHFEGPMLAPTKVGAHDPTRLGPVDVDELASWSAATGVRMVTLAPEVPGALTAIAGLVAAGVTVALGHTACTADEFAAARAAGASAVTHLFNAMAGFEHRAPGPVGATLADPTVVAGLICDGHHVDPIAVAMAWRALGPRRTMLVTDAVAALGVEPGSEVPLGSQPIERGDHGVRTAEGVLAGSDLSMDAAVRNLVRFTGCTAAEALACASRVPAALLGLADRGRLAAGTRADVVLLDTDLRVTTTIVAGRVAWKS